LTSRVTTRTVTFQHTFVLDEIEGVLQPGSYRVETEEETLDSVSFVAYRRIATHIFVPPQQGVSGGAQMWAIHPNGLAAAMARDKATAI
jgi:hypothetical protein